MNDVVKKSVASKEEIIACLAHRIGDYHRAATISVGTGNVDAGVVTIQPHTKFAERDAITGALKKFDMLKDSYRATSKVVDWGHDETKFKGLYFPEFTQDQKLDINPRTASDINRYYLRELIQIINPLMVITCGMDVTSLLVGQQIHIVGKSFSVEDIPSCIFYSTLNPADYGFAQGAQRLKDRGNKEWTKIASIYAELKEKQERERWA